MGCSRAGSPGCATARSSSTCPARRAAAATASRCCSRHSATRSSCSQASRLHTGRHDFRSRHVPAALRVAGQDRAHRLRAAVRLRRRPALRQEDPLGTRPRLDHAGDDRRPFAGDGVEPADRRRDRRAQPALGGAVALWVAGFDLFYSLFDLEVDREQGLHSFATRFGERRLFWGARLAHAATIGLLAAVGFGLHLGVLYWLGVGAVAALLAYEHALVRPGDLRRLNAAFFTMNGIISVVFFGFVLAEAAG